MDPEPDIPVYYLQKGPPKVPKNVVRVKITSPVKRIRDGTFMNCTKLREVEFVEGLVEIGERAFFGCESLELVWLPSTTRVVGLLSFKNCKALKVVAMNEGLEKIMDQAFEACPKLDDVSLPSTVRYLGSQAFRDCINMKKVELNEGLRKINPHTFTNCVNLQKIALPSSIVTVDAAAIPSTTLVEKNVIVKEVSKGANNGTNETATADTESADNQSTTTVEKKIIVKEEPADTESVDNQCATVSMDDDSVFLYHGGEQEVPKDVVRAKIGSSVVKIRARAFENCQDLKLAEFSEGLKIIGTNAFAGCSSLEIVRLPSTTKIIGKNAFSACKSIKEVHLNEGLYKIKEAAFLWCEQMEKLSLPSTVNKIGEMAFSNCKQLKEVDLNDGLEEIGKFAFCHCDELKEVGVPTSVVRVGKEAFPMTTRQEPVIRDEPESTDNNLKEAPNSEMQMAGSDDDDQNETATETEKVCKWTIDIFRPFVETALHEWKRGFLVMEIGLEASDTIISEGEKVPRDGHLHPYNKIFSVIENKIAEKFKLQKQARRAMVNTLRSFDEEWEAMVKAEQPQSQVKKRKFSTREVSDQDGSVKYSAGPVATMEFVQHLLKEDMEPSREELKQHIDKILEEALLHRDKQIADLRRQVKQLKDDRDKDRNEFQKHVADGAAKYASLQESMERLERQLATISSTVVASLPNKQAKKRKRKSADPDVATSSTNVNRPKGGTSDEVIDLT